MKKNKDFVYRFVINNKVRMLISAESEEQAKNFFRFSFGELYLSRVKSIQNIK